MVMRRYFPYLREHAEENLWSEVVTSQPPQNTSNCLPTSAKKSAIFSQAGGYAGLEGLSCFFRRGLRNSIILRTANRLLGRSSFTPGTRLSSTIAPGVSVLSGSTNIHSSPCPHAAVI
jgi:hypothetical protein